VFCKDKIMLLYIVQT